MGFDRYEFLLRTGRSIPEITFCAHGDDPCRTRADSVIAGRLYVGKNLSSGPNGERVSFDPHRRYKRSEIWKRFNEEGANIDIDPSEFLDHGERLRLNRLKDGRWEEVHFENGEYEEREDGTRTPLYRLVLEVVSG